MRKSANCKGGFMTVREQFDDFMRFCKRNKVSIGIVVLMTFLTYGFMLFNFSF